MPDFSVDPAALDQAATTAGAEGAEVRALGGRVSPPPASACGQLLSSAFSMTFPAATDGVKAYLTAMGEGADSIGSTLTASATLYRQNEEAAIDLVETIWGDN